MTNRISFKLAAAEKAKLLAEATVLGKDIRPRLVTLSQDDRQKLPKLTEQTLPFVAKVIDYLEPHPEFAPPYLDVNELKVDVEAFQTLLAVRKLLSEFLSRIDDTMTLSGSEAYTAALAYYDAVKRGARLDVPGAQNIYDDLAVRFEGNGPKSSKQKG